MEIIISHINLDFDGLSSMVAAKKLYPAAKIILHGKLGPGIKEFIGLHKDALSFVPHSIIDINKVKKVIIVDTNQWSRLGYFEKLKDKKDLEIILFDHHPKEHCDIEFHCGEISPVGSTSTILTQIIMEKGIQLSVFEATTIALGIYNDTGNLTFQNTTYRDAQALAYLLKTGTNLEVISKFAVIQLTEEQKQFLEILLNNLILINHNGYTICLSIGKAKKFIPGLSFLISKIDDYESPSAIILIAEMDNKTYIVGRSRDENIDILDILNEYKAKGHKNAASAIIKGNNGDSIIKRLKEEIPSKLPRAITAADIMSTPVKTIDINTKIEEANKIMLRYGHTGLPVVDNGILVGIISRRDLEKAKHHGLGHAPVKGFMSKNVETISPETDISVIQNILIDKDIGRVPVIKNGSIVGIVTRTDLLKVIHGKEHPRWHIKTYKDGLPLQITNIHHGRLKDLDKELLNLLKDLGNIGNKKGYKVYGVGGFIRDIILGKKVKDVDIVVEGDGVSLAQEIASIYKCDLTVHHEFQTASVKINSKYHIDIVTSRREYYEYPASLPKVEKDNLINDLFRRDFTINTLAISLNKNDFGEILDYFGGMEDLNNKRIRVLHNLSFIEDPTRIFRAVRFAGRLNFEIEEQTKAFLATAIEQGVLKELTPKRLLHEIELILKEEQLYRILELLVETNVIKDLFGINNSDRFFDLIKELNEPDIETFFSLLTYNLPYNRVEEVCERFGLERKSKLIVLNVSRFFNQDLEKLSKTTDKYSLYLLLKCYPEKALDIIKFISIDLSIKDRIEDYINNLQHIRLEKVNGNTLKEMGLKPGPHFKEIISTILKEKVNSTDPNFNEFAALKKVLKG